MFNSQEGKKGGGGVWPAKSLENANPAREQKGLGITAWLISLPGIMTWGAHNKQTNKHHASMQKTKIHYIIYGIIKYAPTYLMIILSFLQQNLNLHIGTSVTF